MQAQEKSLVERMETLDQEREELQSQLEKSEVRQSQLQDQLNHVTEEKKTLLDQSAPQQVPFQSLSLCADNISSFNRKHRHYTQLTQQTIAVKKKL